MQSPHVSFLSMLRVVHCQFDGPAESLSFLGIVLVVSLADLLKILRSPFASLNQRFEIHTVPGAGMLFVGCRCTVFGSINGGTVSGGLVHVMSPMSLSF